MNRSFLLISPLSLAVVVWLLTSTIGIMPFLFPDYFYLVHDFLYIESLSVDGFTWMGAAWLVFAFVAFTTGCIVASLSGRLYYGRADSNIDWNRASLILFFLTIVIIAIVLIWVMVTADKLGSLQNLIALVKYNTQAARQNLLDNKLFTGMRALYGTLPAIGALAVVVPMLGKRYGRISGLAVLLSRVTAFVILLALLILPIVMSQRLLLAQYIASSYFLICVINRRITGLKYIPLGIGLFLLTWFAREAITNPTITYASSFTIATQKLVFYFSNDFLNSFMPLNREFEHTLGYFSFYFALYFTQTQEIVTELLQSRLDATLDIRGGGLWSFLTTPYVDFGPIIGALYLVLLGFIVTRVFYRSTQNLMWAALYGQVATAMMLSTHTLHFANINFATGILLTIILLRLFRRAKQL